MKLLKFNYEYGTHILVKYSMLILLYFPTEIYSRFCQSSYASRSDVFKSLQTAAFRM